ncbi:MAG: SDR family oxidoreductase [Caldilineaceae bacterium]|nr:SDR family oxidoreductase [Caldilineaceae bacterium]
MEHSMAGKVCMVTGANSGIGKITALALAKRGATVVMVCRSRERGESAQREVVAESGNDKVDLLLADLSSMASARAMVDAFKAKYDRLNVLVNNAGALFAERQESVDGLEMTFALNHMGYFLPTVLLLDTLKASAPARIINVSSGAHRAGRVDFDDLQSQRKYSSFPVYAKSKLENVLFTVELARRLEGTGVTVNALHPGFVRTNFGGNSTGNGIVTLLFRLFVKFFAISPDKGAETSIYLATSPDVEGVTGQYFDKKKAAEPASQAKNMETARRLWQESERLAGLSAPR